MRWTLLAVLVAVGCGKRPAEQTEPYPAPATPTATTVPTVKATTRTVTPATTRATQPVVRLNAPGERWKGAVCEVEISGAGVLDETLMVPVIVTVSDRKARVSYRAWRDPFGGAKGATLTDDNGTKYDMQGYDAAIDGLIGPLLKDRLKGDIGIGSGAVYADQPRADMLLFDRPTQAAKYLDLDLDAANVGERGTIRFRIPRAAWVKGNR